MLTARAAPLALLLVLSTALACSGRDAEPSAPEGEDAPAKAAEGDPAEPAGDEAPPDAGPKQTLPPPDEKYLGVALEAVRHASVETDADRFKIATKGFSEVSGKRLPPELAKYFADIALITPDQRSRLGAKAVQSATIKPVLEATCGAGVFDKLFDLPPEQHPAHLEERCKLSASGVIDAAALERGHAMNLMVVHLAYHYLETHDSCHPSEKDLLAIIAAIPRDVIES